MENYLSTNFGKWCFKEYLDQPSKKSLTPLNQSHSKKKIYKIGLGVHFNYYFRR